jgi:hypothetical protein
MQLFKFREEILQFQAISQLTGLHENLRRNPLYVYQGAFLMKEGYALQIRVTSTTPVNRG